MVERREFLNAFNKNYNFCPSWQESISHTILHVNIPMCNILVRFMKYLILIILCLLITSCDGGLAPPTPMELGFSGTVYFAPGSWPSADSLINLWIFASKIYPLDSAKVYSGLFSNSPTIFLYPSISGSLQPFNVDSIAYSFPLLTGTYKYIGVIQQTSFDFTDQGIRALRVVGFYKNSTDSSKPGIVEVNNNYQVKGINIDVDFRNPPPQPF